MSQYRPEKRTVGSLLSTTNPPIVVPPWQRSYSWSSSEVETFWRDLVSFDRRYSDENLNGQEYFLGSVVIVDASHEHLLLDGQQRMSTSAILLSVIRDNLALYSRDAATRTQSRYLGDFDDAKEDFAYKISLNEYDRDFFKRAVLEPGAPSTAVPIPTLHSHRLIAAARRAFEDNFAEARKAAASPQAFHKWVLRIQSILTNHMSVVAIFSDDEENAAEVFETLNDRGIGLSTADLVRNLLLRRAPGNAREEIVDLWREVLEVEDDTSLKTFLRHYWVSHYGDVKAQSLYREIKDAVVAQNISSLELSRRLRDAAQVYRDIANGATDDPRLAGLLREVSELGGSVMYPTLLSLWESIGNTESRTRAVSALLSAFVRHVIIGQLESTRLESLLYRLARELRAGLTVPALLGDLRDFCPDDDSFARAFATISLPRTATARCLLRRFEQDLRTTEELDVAPPDRVHVEHVYPQTPRPGERLSNHSQLVDRLGNLTLLSRRLNTRIKNSTFVDKCPSYQQSELLLTRDIAREQTWGEPEILSRQTRLATRAPVLWPLPEA